MVGKLGYLDNNIGTARVGEFGYRFRDISVYTKFGHMLDVLMGSVSKLLMDSLSIYSVAHDCDIWLNKLVWTIIL